MGSLRDPPQGSDFHGPRVGKPLNVRVIKMVLCNMIGSRYIRLPTTRSPSWLRNREVPWGWRRRLRAFRERNRDGEAGRHRGERIGHKALADPPQAEVRLRM